MEPLTIQNLKVRIKSNWLPLVLILLGVLWLAYTRSASALRRIAIAQIAEITNASVDAGFVDLDFNGSVLIKNLVIEPHYSQGDDAILRAKEVHARFGIGSLLLFRPQLRQISVNKFIFDARYDLDKAKWNVAALKIKPPRGGAGKMPVIHLEKGILKYTKISNGQVSVVAAIPLNLRFGPAAKDEIALISGETADVYSFTVKTAKMSGGFGKSTLTGLWRPGNVTVTGGISSADIPAFEKVWVVDVLAANLSYDSDNNYSLQLRIKDLLIKSGSVQRSFQLVEPAFWEKLPLLAALQRFFQEYYPLGKVDIDLEASGGLNRLAQSSLSGRLFCKDVSICYRNFPYLVEHLTGQIDFTQKNVSFSNLKGTHGNVALCFNGRLKNFGEDKQYQINITSKNMTLDNDLYRALNEKRQKFWSAFSPKGSVGIDYLLVRNSQNGPQKTLTVRLLDTRAAYDKFPYPLENLTGTLIFDPDHITFSNVVSFADRKKITINGKVTSYNTESPVHNFHIDAENVPLDSTLAACLSEKQKFLYDRLNITGLADAGIEIASTPDSPQAEVIANVHLKNASLKPVDFPLAAHNISASTVITPDLVTVRSFNGLSGHGTVSLTGRLLPDEENRQLSYNLAINAKNAQLNDELFGILPDYLKNVVEQLQPRGNINYSVNLDKTSGSQSPDYSITLDCLGDSINFAPFPYALKHITGTLNITTESAGAPIADETSPETLLITPNVPTVKITGRIAHADEPSGTARLDLDLEKIKIFDADDGEKFIDFAGTVSFTDCDLDLSPNVTGFNAVVKMQGLYKTGFGFRSGSVSLSAPSLRVKDKALTNLEADLSYDPLLRTWFTKNLIADCYSGKLTGRFVLNQPPELPSDYVLQLAFYDVDVQQFLLDSKLEKTGRDECTTGKMFGSLSLAANTEAPAACTGRCCLKINDMQLARLSPLANLINVLKLTEPTDYAFERMYVDSYIRNSELCLDHFDLSGRSLAFQGSGCINLSTEDIDLTLTARGPRLATAEPSFLQSFTEGLGKGVIRMEVTGNIYDPKIVTKALPVIEDSLHLLGTKPAARR